MAFKIQDKGGSVFYFKREYRGFVSFGGVVGPFACGSYTEDNFPEALARFREEHPNLDVASVVSQKDDDGTVTGYVVVCNEQVSVRQG